jgi:hypothetical protein
MMFMLNCSNFQVRTMDRADFCPDLLSQNNNNDRLA